MERAGGAFRAVGVVLKGDDQSPTEAVEINADESGTLTISLGGLRWTGPTSALAVAWDWMCRKLAEPPAGDS